MLAEMSWIADFIVQAFALGIFFALCFLVLVVLMNQRHNEALEQEYTHPNLYRRSLRNAVRVNIKKLRTTVRKTIDTLSQPTISSTKQTRR